LANRGAIRDWLIEQFFGEALKQGALGMTEPSAHPAARWAYRSAGEAIQESLGPTAPGCFVASLLAMTTTCST